MKTIRIENNFAQVCPGLKIGIIGAQVTNTETDPRPASQPPTKSTK